MSLATVIHLFFPTDDSPFRVSLKENPALQSSESYEHQIISEEDMVKHTKSLEVDDSIDTVDVFDDSLSLENAWKTIVEQNETESIVCQSWFVLWQSAIHIIQKHYTTPQRLYSSSIQTVRFLLTKPNFFSWIGIQTLRNIKEATVEPILDVYLNKDIKWRDPNGADWSNSFKDFPENPMKRLPLNLWNKNENEWVEGAALEQHQTEPLMYMNEQSPMPGVLFYHFLGKGKSAASISVSRMYPNRKVIVMVPASLRSNYEKEIEAFGGDRFRTQNEWVFIPVAAHNGRKLQSLWTPASQFQRQLPLISFSSDTEEKLQGYWLPRTYVGRHPNINIDEMGPSMKYIKSSVQISKNKRFRIIHYNAGESTYRQLVRYGLDYNARLSLLNTLSQTTDEEIDVVKSIFETQRHKEKVWNKFPAKTIVDTILKAAYTHPEWNPLNGSMVIVDESHNFISQNMTKLGNLMYSLRMLSPDCRTVLLSGTPIMNHPLELTYMFDYLRGPDITYTITTTENPKDAWKPGCVHTQITTGGQKRIQLTIPAIGWAKNSDGIMMIEPEITIDGMKKFFGRKVDGGEVVLATSGQMRPVSGHKIKFAYDVDKKQYLVDKDRTLADFNSTFLNGAQTALRTDSDLVQKMTSGIVSYQGKTMDISSEFPESETVQERCQMNFYQALIYLIVRLYEAEREEKMRKTSSRADDSVSLEAGDRRIADAATHLVAEAPDADEGDKKTSGVYRIFSRQACNMVFPGYIPYDLMDKKTAGDADPLNNIKKADCVLKTHPMHSSGDSKTSLEDYSTKYAKALENMKQSPGLVLLYTFFRVREGIDMMEKILQHYGGRKVKKSGVIEPRLADDASMKLTATHPEDATEYTTSVCMGDLLLKAKPGVNEPIFVQLMEVKDAASGAGSDGEITDDTEVVVLEANGERTEGTWKSLNLLPFQYCVVSGEDKEDRDAMIQLYRSLRNKKGIDAAIMMITKAGAEGLDLKSVRQVHVLEPFWNEVRVKQVIGRGSRNKSHNYLDPAENTVKNFIYTCVLSQKGQEMNVMMQKKISHEEVAMKVMGMEPEEISELVNVNLQNILSLGEATEWASHIGILYGQYVNDRMMTSDEFLLKTAEHKQVLVDQALKLFIHNSLEQLLNMAKKYAAKPVFLSPLTVYMNPNIPLETYMENIRDTLAVKQNASNPTPMARFKIPVYYVPHLVSRSPKWNEELIEQRVSCKLETDGSLTIKVEDPLEGLMANFERLMDRMLKGRRLGKTDAEHYKNLPIFAAKMFRKYKLDSNIVFLKDQHKLAVILDLLVPLPKASVGQRRSEGVFKEMVESGKQLGFNKDGLVLDFSDYVEKYWRQNRFKG